MAGKDLEKFIERYPTYIEALEMLEDKDQRIAELEQDLEFTTKTANELIEIKHKLEQELAIKDKMINLIWIDLFHLNNDNNDWTKSVAQYQKESIEKLKEGDTNE